MEPLTIIIYIFLGIGIFFQAMGTFALHRFPDVYTRIHGSTKCTTFGSIFLYFSVILVPFITGIEGLSHNYALSIHAFFALVLLLITNPTGAHAIAQAAHEKGVAPKKAVVNKLKEYRESQE